MPLDRFVWMAWSIKESVYKYLKRNNADLVFSPTKIIIQNIEAPLINLIEKFETILIEQNGFGEEFYKGSVVYGSNTVFFSSKVDQEIIITVSNDGQSLEKIFWGIKKINNTSYDGQSKAVRGFILKRLNHIFPELNLGIEKSETGYPIIIQNQQKQLNIPCSFAHHDNFIFYAFLLDNMPDSSI